MSNAVAKLVPLERELKFDDTFNDVNAVMRFDAKIEKSDLKVQLLVDFRDKKGEMWKSKPRFYGTISQPEQFEDLITATLAMACFHRLRKEVAPKKEEILAYYDDIVKWLRDDVQNLVQILFRDVRKRRGNEDNHNLEKYTS